MHLRFSSNSNNLNAQLNKLHNLKIKGIMHRGLPLVASIESVSFSSSEYGFGTSVNSATLAWALEISPFGSWISSYVPSSSDITFICNAVSWN